MLYKSEKERYTKKYSNNSALFTIFLFFIFSVHFPHKGTHFIPIQQEQTYLQSTQQLKTKEG